MGQCFYRHHDTMLSICLLILTIISTQSQRVDPPPSDPEPVCVTPPCTRRLVNVKVYIDDNLWLVYESQRGNISIPERVTQVFSGVNNHLKRLDNGGYKIVTDGSVVRMSESDVYPLGPTYVDRNDGDKIKTFVPEDKMSQAFAFQEAVFALPNSTRKEVDLRAMFMFGRCGGNAEEMCICEQHTVFNYGCIAVFCISSLSNWSVHSALIAHEFGHALGVDFHDDFFYTNTWGNKLLMWPGVGRSAHIWSPKARESIRKRDHSCLKTKREKVLPSSGHSETGWIRFIVSCLWIIYWFSY